MHTFQQNLVVIVTAWVVLIAIGCAKDDNASNKCGNKEDCLIGKWDWVQSIGGIGGWTLTPDSVGYHKTLVITNTTFQLFNQDTLEFQSDYSIINSADRNFCIDSLQLKVASYHTYCFSASQDTLYLREQCFDCFDHWYVRK